MIKFIIIISICVLVNLSCSGAKIYVNILPPEISLRPIFRVPEIYMIRDPRFTTLAGIQNITNQCYQEFISDAKINDYPENLSAIESAIKLNPQNSDAYFIKADILFINNRLTEAVEQYSYGNLLKQLQSELQSKYPPKIPDKEDFMQSMQYWWPELSINDNLIINYKCRL